jgi:aspartyl-tRNA(Asn)/glutamyl-tRNA(Gln) amidotransferase subunit A
MEATLARIGAVNEKLNAFVAMRDEESLLRDAREAGERIARGEARALEGVPLGVKDLEDTAGMVTSKGSVPFKDNLAAVDSIQVERLRAAGAIVVGKTNAPEFGYTAITKNLLFGATRNPWNLERTPGGSSGGSSAAIAAGMIPLATASDGGGSVRLPATFTGCFGLKTSYGRIPNGPHAHWETGDTAVHGPLTRTPHGGRCSTPPRRRVRPPPPRPEQSASPGLRVPRRSRAATPEPALRLLAGSRLRGRAVRPRGAGTFEELGHHLEEVKGGPPELGREWGMANSFEMLGKLAHLLPDHEQEFGRTFIEGTKTGAHMTSERYAALLARREELNRWCAEIFDRVDLLLTPTVPYDPPPARGPFPTEIEGRRLPWASVASFTIPFNLSWHPAATVRAGFSKAGLPVGLQIVGPRHRDDLVLQAAHAFEQARPWAHEWPEL